LRQHNETSFQVLTHIVLVNRTFGNVSVISSDIANALDTQKSIDINDELGSLDIANPLKRYVSYDKHLIVKARQHMENFIQDQLTPVTISYY
jgi:hypothetical protein